MTIDYADAIQAARMNEVLAAIDSGTGQAMIQIFEGPRPAKGADASAYTVLCEVDIASPAGTVTNGELALDVEGSSIVLATGSHAWARILSRDGVFVADLDTGETGSGADMEIGTPTLVQGGNILVASAYLRDY